MITDKRCPARCGRFLRDHVARLGSSGLPGQVIAQLRFGNQIPTSAAHLVDLSTLGAAKPAGGISGVAGKFDSHTLPLEQKTCNPFGNPFTNF